jgi:competence protein ComEC
VILLATYVVAADQLRVVRSSRLYEDATSASQNIRTLGVGEILTGTGAPVTNDYIQVTTTQGELGWVYRHRVVVLGGTGSTSGSGGSGGTVTPGPIHGTTTRAFSQLAPITGTQMRVHFIDVGQGASTLLEFPCGAALIDTGGESVPNSYDSVPALRGYLDAFFQSRPDLNRTFALLALTHPHIDHTNGVAMVSTTYGLTNVIDNGQRNQDLGGWPQINLEDMIQQSPGTISYLGIRAADVPAGGLTSSLIDPIGSCTASTIDPRIRVLWGQMGAGDAGAGNPNNNSLAIRVDFGQFSLLVDGDLQEEGIHGLLGKYAADPQLLDVDVWEVGHHGSHNATTADLVKALSPKLAVICMGPYERDKGSFIARKFGHPHRDAIHALEAEVTCHRTPVQREIGVKGSYQGSPPVWEQDPIQAGIFGTGWEGNIVLTANADGTFSIWTEKDGGNDGLSFGH